MFSKKLLIRIYIESEIETLVIRSILTPVSVPPSYSNHIQRSFSCNFYNVIFSYIVFLITIYSTGELYILQSKQNN